MRAIDIIEWLDSLPKDTEVVVDEGGLCLQVKYNNAVYLEIGGSES